MSDTSEEEFDYDSESSTDLDLPDRLARFHKVTLEPPHCPCCRDQGTLKCAGCLDVLYCSAECQYADWPVHKSLCGKLSRFQKRPNPNARRAIFFDRKAKTAQFVWINKDPKRQIIDIFGEHKYDTRRVDYNPLTQVRTHRTIHVFFDNEQPFTMCRHHFFDDDQANMAIVGATAGRPGDAWAGHVIAVLGARSGEFEVGQVTDMDLTTYSALAAWLMWFANDRLQDNFRIGEKVQAVKMWSEGERKVLGVPAREEVKLPRTHHVFESWVQRKVGLIQLARLVGLPLLMHRLPLKTTPNAHQCNYNANQKASYMQYNMDLNSSDFGSIPGRHDTDLRNVIIARADGKPLTAEIVQAFGDFCFYHIKEWFSLVGERHPDNGDCSKERWEEIKKMVVAEAAPEKWQVYLSDWRKVKAGVEDDAEVNGRVDGKVRMGLNEEDGEKLSDHLFSTIF